MQESYFNTLDIKLSFPTLTFPNTRTRNFLSFFVALILLIFTSFLIDKLFLLILFNFVLLLYSKLNSLIGYFNNVPIFDSLLEILFPLWIPITLKLFNYIIGPPELPLLVELVEHLWIISNSLISAIYP